MSVTADGLQRATFTADMATPRTYDRVRNFGGGVDMYRPADQIDQNQSSLMENVIVFDNFAVRTRYGFDLADSNPSTFSRVNPQMPVQGLFFFNNPTVTEIILAEGGNLYTWNGASWSNPLAMTLANANLRPAMAQGIDKVMISDGVNPAQIFDGTNFVSCGTAAQTNAPVGCTILCFSAGRMVASGTFVNPSTGLVTTDTVYCSNLLSYGAGQWDSAALSFRVGDGDGEAIVALAAMQNQILAVLKQNSVWLVDMNSSGTNATNPTSNWSVAPQGDLVGAGVGCVGRDAWCLYQNDLIFMSQDGVQSLQRMQAAAGQYQLTSPLSLQIQPLIDRINWSAANGIKAIKYRQLAIFFVPLDISTSNNYALVWNGRLGQWTGYWLNVNASDAVATRFGNVEELYVGDGVTGYVNKWKDNPDISDIDGTYLDNGVAIPCEVDTRALIFGNPDAQKKMRAALFRFNTGNATINFSATLDLSDDDDWQGSVQPTGAILGVNTVLPFLLSSSSPVEVYRSLSGLDYCNEAIFKISTTAGWWELQRLTASAFLKNIRDPAA